MALNRVLPITREAGRIIVVVDRVLPERISRSFADNDDKRTAIIFLSPCTIPCVRSLHYAVIRKLPGLLTKDNAAIVVRCRC
jgi:hypothetical protein